MCHNTNAFPADDHPKAPRIEEIISPVHLEELRSMRDILPALLKTFRSSSLQSFDLIKSAIESNEPGGLARAAHGITGAAGSLGGQRLAASCRDLERIGRAGSVDGALGVFPHILEEYDLLCEALESVSTEQKETSSEET